MTAVQRIAQRSAIIDAEMQKLALANLRYGIAVFSFVPMIRVITVPRVLSLLRIRDVYPGPGFVPSLISDPWSTRPRIRIRRHEFTKELIFLKPKICY